MPILNEALAGNRNVKARNFRSILSEVQGYVSSTYSNLLSAEGEEQIRQLKNYMSKYVEDNGLAAEDLTTVELVDKLYEEMAGYSVLDQYLYRNDIEEININRWDDIKITYSDGSKKPSKERFKSPVHALDVLNVYYGHRKLFWMNLLQW